tara:strand:- start:2200 stop:2400 length:201 start_codon:yes stop_codon:yes gene_type:complete
MSNSLETEILCNTIIQSHIDRMHQLCDDKKFMDAECLYSEIQQWVIEKENLTILSLPLIPASEFEE